MTPIWFNFSIYISEVSWHDFLHDFLKQELMISINQKLIFSYYINLSKERGDHIVVFIEGTDKEEFFLYFDRLFKSYLNKYKDKVIPKTEKLGHSLFMNIPEMVISYNYERLRADPFLYFIEQERILYFDVLKCFSEYLMELNKKAYDLIIENNFIFSFCMLLAILKSTTLSELRCYHVINDIVTKEIAIATAKLDKDIELGMIRNFKKNQEILLKYYESLFKDTYASANPFMNDAFIRFTKVISIRFNNHPILQQQKLLVVFISSLIKDVYKVIGFDQELTCIYFIKSSFEIKTKYKELII